jgi:uncharacterized membrane protein YhaH (DUF805 family)
MTFVESIQTCFKKYADFSGRASRSEYWWWALFVLLITIVGQVIGDILGGIASLAMLLPYLAVTSRRLHDIGKSGWWQLIGFIPLIGWVVLIYWCVQGPKEPNTYG